MSVLEDIERGRSRVRAALISAEGLSGRQVGEHAELSKRLELPPALTASVPELVMREKVIRQIEQDDGLVNWAARSKENAALARDDTDGLSGVFAQAREFASSVGGYVANFGNDALHWALFDAANDLSDFGKNAVNALYAGTADVADSFYNVGRAVAENTLGEQSAVAAFFRDLAANSARQAAAYAPRAESAVGQFGYDFLRSAPQILSSLALAVMSNGASLPAGAGGLLPSVGAGTRSVVSASTAPAAYMATHIFGSTYGSLREQGVSPARSGMAGAANALAQAPLERLSLGRFAEIFKSAHGRDTLVRTLGASATEFLTEYAQKWPETAAMLWGLAEKQSPDAVEQLQWFGRTLFDAETLWQAHKEGMYEGAIGAIWGGLGGSMRALALRNMERQRAEDFARQNIALHDSVEASETRRLAPDHMADALESASDVLAQSVFIPAQAALELAEQGRDVLTPLGISVERARRAAEADIDLEVKLSEIHSRLDAESMAAIAPLLRQRADVPNALEAEQMDNAAQAQAVVEESRVRQRVADAVQQEEKRLVSEMTPLVGKNAAETFGRLHAAQARAFETAYGVDAADLLRRRSVALGEKGEAEGQTFSQPGTLPSRFAAMPLIEADSTQWFGEGKELPAIPVEELDAGQKKQLRDSVQGWAKQHFGMDTLVSNADRGWDVRITAKGVKDTLHHGFDPLLAKSVPFIPQIIEGGTHLDSMEKKPGLMSHIFANKIRLDGQEYVVGFVLREDGNGNRFYDHELTEIINPDQLKPVKQREAAAELQTDQDIPQITELPVNQGDVINILRDRLGVNDGTGQVLFQARESGAPADTFGRLHAAQARAFETAYGVDAAGLMKRRSVELGRGDAQGEALHQAALYEQTPLGETARASLERDIRDFGTAVDGIVAAGKLPSSPVKMLGQTPLVMRLLGRDTVTGKAAAQGGVYAAPHVFDGTHPNMTPEMWKQIPGALADPVAVFDSDSPKGRANGDLVFMLELTDAGGATVVVPVALQARGKLGARINIVKSAYAKESGGIPANTWFLRQLKKNARYVNGQKWKHWRDIGSGADSPLVVPSNASGNTVYTDADLVNLRQGNPTLYQSEVSGDSPALRAQVTLDAETAAIRIFKGADLSSIPHESAHIFVDDLRRVAADDGSMARERLRLDLEQSGMDVTPFAGILSGEVDAERARSMLRDAREELAMLDDGDAGLRAAAKVAAKNGSDKESREESLSALRTNAARRRELLPAERRLAAYVRHLDGLDQARRDMATLRRFAGVAEDGELTDARSGEAAGRHPRRAHRSAGHGTDHHGGGQAAGRRRKAGGAGTGDPACRCGGHPQGARFRRARHPAAAYPRF